MSPPPVPRPPSRVATLDSPGPWPGAAPGAWRRSMASSSRPPCCCRAQPPPGPRSPATCRSCRRSGRGPLPRCAGSSGTQGGTGRGTFPDAAMRIWSPALFLSPTPLFHHYILSNRLAVVSQLTVHHLGSTTRFKSPVYLAMWLLSSEGEGGRGLVRLRVGRAQDGHVLIHASCLTRPFPRRRRARRP